MNILHEAYALVCVELWYVVFYGIEGEISGRWKSWKEKKRDWIVAFLFFAVAFLIAYFFGARLVTLGLIFLALLSMDHLLSVPGKRLKIY